MLKRLLLAVLLLAPGLAQAAAINHIQSYISPGGSGCSVCVVSGFTPIVTGDTATIIVLAGQTNTTITLSDPAGNTYTSWGSTITGSNSTWAVFSGLALKNISQLTITFGTTQTFWGFWLDEFSNVNGITSVVPPAQNAASGYFQTVSPHVANAEIWQYITQGSTLPAAPSGFTLGVVDNTSVVETAYGNGPASPGPITPIWATTSGGQIGSLALSPSPCTSLGVPTARNVSCGTSGH